MRLVDLHCDWLRQYATETTLYPGQLYPEIPRRVGRLDGYLLGTSLAVLACGREPEDWSSQPDPWGSLGLMIARCEAEFAGRILRDAGDVARWRSAPPEGMCWGVLGVAGFDFLVREAADLERLPSLFARGVRVWQPVAAGGALGGADVPGDNRGLSNLGRASLDRLVEMTGPGESDPRPILDCAGMNAATAADTIRWYDEVPPGRHRPLLALSHGVASGPDGSSPQGPVIAEIRGRGGVVGVTPGLPGCETPEELKSLIETIAAVPISGRTPFEGIAIGTDLLAAHRGVPGLSSAREIARWLARTFDRQAAYAIAAGNARALLLRAVGYTSPEEEAGFVPGSPA